MLYACKPTTMTNPNTVRLNTLQAHTYTSLFTPVSGTTVADSIWQGGKGQAGLVQIVQTDSLPFEVRFLAAEVLHQHNNLPTSTHAQYLAKIYAWALQHTATEEGMTFGLMGNMWGMLYEHDDAGTSGQVLPSLGKAAIPLLTPMLKNKAHIEYEGSREATTGHLYQYRVKDFAAYYLHKITQEPITFYQDHAQRDQEIERFAQALKAKGHI